MRALLLAVAVITSAATAPASAQETVRLHAAGSLRQAMTELSQAYERAGGTRVTLAFGASGLLRERLAGGEESDVFASANMEHPQALAGIGKSGPVALFARNKLCVLVRPGVDVSPSTLLERMLDPTVKLGTSTPLADPSGDYAWELFRRAERVRAGSFQRLDAKALKLTGGPNSPQPLEGRSVYADALRSGSADLFLAYCNVSQIARAEWPELKIVEVPSELAVGADYGITVMRGASERGAEFAMFVLSPEGQRILARNGFDAPALPFSGETR